MDKTTSTARHIASSTGEQHQDVANIDANATNKDEFELAAQGKKQVTNRNFSFLAVVALAVASSIIWEGILITFVYGLENGGPAGSVYELLASWIGFTAINASLGELASMAPTAGGSYHWVYLFAPAGSRKVLSYVTGWLQVISWQAAVASGAYLSAGTIQGLAILNYPEYAHKIRNWQGTLVVDAVLLMTLLVNSALGRFLPQIETFILVFHCTAFVAVLVPLIYFAPHGSAKDVFTVFLTSAGYDSKGLAFFVGTVGASFSYTGSDCPIHLCEEVKNASTVVPWAMVISSLLNGALGFATVITVLFCLGNVEEALNTPTGFPIIEVFKQAVQSTQGATAMIAIVVTLILGAGITVFAGTSRMTWAFARDKGIPGSRWIGQVDSKTKLPLWSMFVTTLLSILLSLINIGSPVAFNALVSLTVSGFLTSYLIPIALITWLKLTKPKSIRYGPWRLGRWGLFINFIAISWCILAMVFSFFPSNRIDLTLQTMNWSCLMYGGTMIIAMALYPIYGRYRFKGPIIETDMAELLL